MRLCAAGFTSSQRNPRYCETVGRSILTDEHSPGVGHVRVATARWSVFPTIGHEVGLSETCRPNGPRRSKFPVTPFFKD